MREILARLAESLAGGRPVAYTALVETRGSTPQKAGAAMLVFPDGSQAGTLGGGCVEAEVKRRALRLLEDGRTEILEFNLDGDYGWDDGLICGGRMRMLVDPLRPGGDASYFETYAQRVSAGRPCTEVVVVEPAKAGGGSPGDRVLLDEQGLPLATRAASEAPSAIREHLRSLEGRPRPYVVAGLSFLPQLRRCRLLVVGAGHVGQSVADLAAAADFDVWVVDDREQYCNRERFPRAKGLVVGAIEDVLAGEVVGAGVGVKDASGGCAIDGDTFCIVVTRGHGHDEQALFHLAERPARYVGMIGSKRKIKMIFEDLRAAGISDAALDRVHAPLGIDIGSQTVPEIAVSIVAELIAVRNLGGVPAAWRTSG